MRYVLLVMMIILALIGIPVVPPRRLETDNDEEIKTEISEDKERSQN